MNDVGIFDSAFRIIERSAQPTPVPAFKWATVSQIAPVKIRLDGESVLLQFTSTAAAVSKMVVNDRLLVVWQDTQLIVLANKTADER